MSTRTPTTDIEIFLMEYILAIQGKVEIDWDQFKNAVNLGEGSAKNKLRDLKKNYQATKAPRADSDATATANITTPTATVAATPRKPVKRKATEEGDGTAKKATRTKAAKGKTTENVADED